MPLLLESLKDGIPRELVHETIANAYRLRGDLAKAIVFLKKNMSDSPIRFYSEKSEHYKPKKKQWLEASVFLPDILHVSQRKTHIDIAMHRSCLT